MMTALLSSESELISFESLKCLLLEMAQELSVETLLRTIVERLAAEPAVAGARVCLLQRKGFCQACPLDRHCPERASCVRLAASAESPDFGGAGPNGEESPLESIAVDQAALQKIVATGSAIVVPEIDEDPTWRGCASWLPPSVAGFVGQPLLRQGEVLGVLSVFTRVPATDEAATWLRVVAHHAAAAVANARAFEEIRRLQRRLEQECDYLREEVRDAHSFGEIVGRSAALVSLLEQIDLVAPTDASVLILGESGTGKELVAREIHKRSRRRDRPMIKVNCASVPRELYESEFFGHVRGAFTGALKDRAGRFELADGGTLFLDEVGEIPYSLQGKLLRVLQEGEFERVGEEKTRRVDVRIIAATNRDLKNEVAGGRFRQDLYYRLNVFPIEVAPLRRHKEDIPLLAAHFIERAAARANRPRPRLTQADVVQLQQYDWPGNVRELWNVLERAVITSRHGTLQFDLPGDQAKPMEPPPPAAPIPASESPQVIPAAEMRRRERDNLLAALAQTDWRIYGPHGAAALLGMKPTTLASRMKKLGLVRPAPA